ncbi:hypothetical protein AHAS_Ahas07G0054900 [Arachis hypogaea]
MMCMHQAPSMEMKDGMLNSHDGMNDTDDDGEADSANEVDDDGGAVNVVTHRTEYGKREWINNGRVHGDGITKSKGDRVALLHDKGAGEKGIVSDGELDTDVMSLGTRGNQRLVLEEQMIKNRKHGN